MGVAVQSKTENELVPFIKWAGGKRWLVGSHPEIFEFSYERYVEPFLGSAAVFFSLRPKKARLSDVNSELIDCYIAIRDDYRAVEEALRRHQVLHSQDYYYKVRAEASSDLIERAARFLYLNRTCFNGLYRVNLRGVFNVPVGTKTNVVLPTDNFKTVSDLLSHVDIEVNDFEDALADVGDGDLVYLDPPYTVQHNQNGFLKYNEKIFSWSDQLRLKKAAIAASNRGAKVIISNAAHDSVKSLYSTVGSIITISRSSIMAADRSRRGRVEEIVVVL